MVYGCLAGNAGVLRTPRQAVQVPHGHTSAVLSDPVQFPARDLSCFCFLVNVQRLFFDLLLLA